MKIFIVIAIAHFIEHFSQIYQLKILVWDRAECLGLLGLWQPILVKSEILHFALALYMAIALYIYCYQFGKSALLLQILHLFEHTLLITSYWFYGTALSIGGLWFPRIELHFFYNLVVLIAMMQKINRRGVSI